MNAEIFAEEILEQYAEAYSEMDVEVLAEKLVQLEKKAAREVLIKFRKEVESLFGIHYITEVLDDHITRFEDYWGKEMEAKE